MAGPQGRGRTPHRRDALAGDFGGVWLAEHLAPVFEHGVAADDKDGLTVGQVGAVARQGLAHVEALGRSECAHLVCGGGCGARERAAPGKSGQDRVLVDGGHSNEWRDARRDERCSAGGGSGGKNEAHRPIVDHGGYRAQSS